MGLKYNFTTDVELKKEATHTGYGSYFKEVGKNKFLLLSEIDNIYIPYNPRDLDFF